MRTLWILGLIALIMVQTVSADEGVPTEELDSLLPKTDVSWKRAMLRHNSLEWFVEQCKAATLPLPEAGFFSKEVVPYGTVELASGSPYMTMVYPTSEYIMDSEHAYVYLSYDLDMTFGLYCAYTYPGASVRLTCWDQWTYFDCREDNNTFELAGGTATPILVHETRGVSRGHYRAEMRCENKQPCNFGAVLVVNFEPTRLLKTLEYHQWIGNYSGVY